MINIINSLGQIINYRRIEFSDGTRNVVIDMPSYLQTIKTETVTFNIPADESNEAVLFELLMLADAFKALPKRQFTKVDLFFNYMPHGRADRRFEEGAAFPLHVFFKTLLKGFDMPIGKIYIVDAHNPTAIRDLVRYNIPEAEQLLTFVNNKTLINHFIPEGAVVVFPDAGAFSRYSLQWPGSVKTEKSRDPASGKITGITVPDDVKKAIAGKTAVILDDICDGGGTFIPLAETLKLHADRVHLVVTHGIFSKGLEPFKGFIDQINCVHFVGDYVTGRNLIKFNENNALNHNRNSL